MLRIVNFKLSIIAAVVLAQSAIAADQLTVHFRSGTTLTGVVAEPEIAWLTVAPNGAVTNRTYEISELKSLTISESESSAQLIQVRQLLNQLGDDDYHQREAAERQLLELGDRYRGVIEAFADHSSYEVRYRHQRLIKELKTSNSAAQDLDGIVLVNGASFEGEVKDFALTFEAYGKTFLLNRANVFRLTAGGGKAAVGVAATPPADVKLFHRFQDFNGPGQKELRFDVQADGKAFPLKTKLNSVFVADGLRMRSRTPGFVGTSPFSFKYPDMPVGGLSVGLLGQERGRDYRGVMEFSFCEPGDSGAAAGVYEFGTFIAKVSSRRDIILEAYGCQGQLLATVEATDQRCVFAGVKSNQLIAKVLILSNPYLEKIERVIDDDFAIDTLRFSRPVAIRSYSPETSRLICMANGDRFDWAGMNINGKGQLEMSVDKISDTQTSVAVPMADVRVLAFGRQGKSSNSWQTLLDDGSRINVLPGKSFKSEQFGITLSPDDFVATWPAGTAPRLPVAGDMKENTAPLVVFPTCRIRTHAVTFSADRLSWKVRQKLQQPLQLGDKDSDEDPTPSQTAFKYSDTLANQLPTIWNRAPKVMPEGKGFVYLVDGQRLAIGEGGSFELINVGHQSISVAYEQGKPIAIGLADVHTIVFGK